MTEPPPPINFAAVRGLVFDLDGTLVDSYAAIAESLNHARAAWELPPLPMETVRTAVGRGLEMLVAEWIGPDRVDEGVRRFRERYASVYAARTHALPGVREALAVLHERGYRMAVASNKPARFGRPIVEALGLDGMFDTVEGPDTAGATKPEPAMLGACLAAMGVAPRNALYVGDMPLDVLTAAQAGLPVVLVVGGSASPEELSATGQQVVGSLGELADRLTPLRA